MRAPQHRQPGDRTPLNDILGTEAAVRILRALAASDHKPVGVTALAQNTALERSSTRRSLATLSGTGIVEPLGSGRTVLYRLRAEHPLADAIAALFATEVERAADVAAAFPPAERPSRELGSATESGRPRHADPAREIGNAVRFDVQSPRLARHLADRIVMDPTLVERALAHVVAQIPVAATPAARFQLEQWARVLRIWAPTRIARLMTERDDRAARLRESMPFPAVMRADELDALRRAAERGETQG